MALGRDGHHRRGVRAVAAGEAQAPQIGPHQHARGAGVGVEQGDAPLLHVDVHLLPVGRAGGEVGDHRRAVGIQFRVGRDLGVPGAGVAERAPGAAARPTRTAHPARRSAAPGATGGGPPVVPPLALAPPVALEPPVVPPLALEPPGRRRWHRNRRSRRRWHWNRRCCHRWHWNRRWCRRWHSRRRWCRRWHSRRRWCHRCPIRPGRPRRPIPRWCHRWRLRRRCYRRCPRVRRRCPSRIPRQHRLGDRSPAQSRRRRPPRPSARAPGSLSVALGAPARHWPWRIFTRALPTDQRIGPSPRLSTVSVARRGSRSR